MECLGATDRGRPDRLSIQDVTHLFRSQLAPVAVLMAETNRGDVFVEFDWFVQTEQDKVGVGANFLILWIGNYLFDL